MPVSSSNMKYKATGGASKKTERKSKRVSRKSMKGGDSKKKMVGGSKKTKKTPMKANEGYCMNCKKRVTMTDVKDVTKKTAKRTMKMRIGKCSECHKNVYKIVGGG